MAEAAARIEDSERLLWLIRNRSDTPVKASTLETDRFNEDDKVWGPLPVLTLRSALHKVDDGHWGIQLVDSTEPIVFEFESATDHEGGWLLKFTNGDIIDEPGDQLGADERVAVDVGLHLLEPVTAVELATIEPMLAELWAALDSGELTEVQHAQIVAMAELIKAEQQASIPGETQRWRVVGAIRAVLRYLAKDVPKDALAWWKLIELLDKIDWTNIAGELAGL